MIMGEGSMRMMEVEEAMVKGQPEAKTLHGQEVWSNRESASCEDILSAGLLRLLPVPEGRSTNGEAAFGLPEVESSQCTSSDWPLSRRPRISSA